MAMLSVPNMVSLMLAAILFLLASVDCSLHGHMHHHNGKVLARMATPARSLAATTTTVDDHAPVLQGPAKPCSGSTCVTAVPVSSDLCPGSNETAWNGSQTAQDYTVICDVDFPAAHDIHPFILAGSFEACMAACESYNAKNVLGEIRCEGFVFAPGRIQNADDCYLKSSLERPFPATISLVGAMRAPFLAFTATPLAQATSAGSFAGTLAVPSSLNLLSPPKVVRSRLHGASVNNPTSQWVSHEPVNPLKLEDDLLVPGINCDLITEFDISNDTGPRTPKSAPFKDELLDLSVVPHPSRDGGKGGELDGHHIFTFCDTATFIPPNETFQGEMVSFTSSSVATDDGRNGISGKPLSLVDGVGQWNDDVGRMRGYSPMTHGEQSFNIALSGNGHRYCVWPASSIIPLNKTHGLQYASLVYAEVDMSNQEAEFTAIGNTLLTISVDGKYGPTAERTVKRLFHQNEVQWGSIGGIRSWGSKGIGEMGGKVYIFGGTTQGILVARTDAVKVADRDSYEYWNGKDWSSGQLPSTATSFLIDQPVMDFDLIYSPHHKTFIMVYLVPLLDNTFHYRYLNVSSAIIPPYAEGGHPTSDYDYVEEILKHPWSDEQVLYKADIPPSHNFIYSGSVHAGYFGDEDITKGGTKMLLSWTEHTGEDAASPKSGYAHMTVDVELE